MSEYTKYGQYAENPEKQEASWHGINVAGRRFNIASRHGEEHIRQVERLLNETYEEVNARIEGQPILNVAFLTALNLADQLLSLKESREGQSDEWNQRVQSMMTRLEAALPENNAGTGTGGGGIDGNPGPVENNRVENNRFDTPAVFD